MRGIVFSILCLLASGTWAQENDIIELICNTGIDKYSHITFQSKERHPELDGVTNYFFDTKDCRCFEGEPFMVGLRFPNASNYVLNESGSGLTDSNKHHIWETLRESWGMETWLPKEFPDRFKRFFLKGDSHCVEDYFYAIDGMTYAEWVGHFLNDNTAWTDRIVC